MKRLKARSPAMAVLRLACTFLLLASGPTMGTILFSAPNQRSIDEEPVSGTTVLTASVDDDSGAPTLTLSLDPINDFNLFAISQAGALTTTGRLDRETRTVYSCTIRAVNSLGDQNTHTVRVTLMDINDNSPVFQTPIASVIVLEDAPINTIAYNATATDADLVERTQVLGTVDGLTVILGFRYTISNGRVFYDILSGNTDGKFRIDRDTGAVLVNDTLSVNVQKEYTLQLNASDPGGRFDTANVTIRIGDANDNAPVFLSPLPFNVTLSEDTALGHVILAGAFANDTDFGSNAEVTYALTSGNENGEFSVNTTTGRITLVQSLDYERSPVIRLVLAAQDSGMPRLQDTVGIMVRLLDVNDNAPAFLSPSYTEPVPENQDVNTVFMSVRAVDRDGPGNGSLVRYAFVPGFDAGGMFRIDEVSGEVALTRSLDRESVARYDLRALASDQDSDPSRRMASAVNVTIVVTDINDNTPRFTMDPFVGGLLDGDVRTSEAVRLNATDADQGLNAELRYSLTDDEGGAFQVDRTTGVVTLALTSVSYTTKRFYNLMARVQDNAPPFRPATVPVIVEIHQHNPSAPIFSPSIYAANISESLPVGTTVLRVSATDADPNQIGVVRYEVVLGPGIFDLGGSFEVNNVTGDVYVSTQLDRDVRGVHKFSIVAKDGGFPSPKVDYANLTITLMDVNDVAPIFEANMSARLQENLPNRSLTIYQLRARDPDLLLGGQFTFSMLPGDWPSGLFTVDPISGNVSAHFGVDRESKAQFTLTVMATDRGVPPLSSQANVTIYVDDVNDNGPYFTRAYDGSILENATIGAKILTVSAMDDDVGLNAVPTYSIVSGDDQNQFAVGAVTGRITVASALNRELAENYTLTVQAMDAAGHVTEGTVTITVLDVNDNAPTFASSVLAFSLPESYQVGTTAYTLLATDADIGNALTFNLSATGTGASILSYLSVSPQTGNLTLVQALDREAMSQLVGTVWVSDGVFMTSARLQLTILDVNDVVPKFDFTKYTVMITEAAGIGTSLVTVRASDNDTDAVNQAFHYELVAGNEYGWFAVHPSSGIVTTIAGLDRETLPVVNLTVGAVNTAAPNLTGTADVVITLGDINDSPPDFGPSPRVISIKEAGYGGFSAGYLNATDADLSNNTVWYRILDDNTRGAARINELTGEVTIVFGLDYEQQSEYYIVVRADDRGIPPLHSTTNATLMVVDVNDNAPLFRQSSYSVTIAEDRPAQSSVVQLAATDKDSTSNAALTYSFSPDTEPFEIHPITGLITISSTLDRENISFYNLTAEVQDGGFPPINSSVPLWITVQDVNDSPPRFESSVYTASVRENVAAGTTLVRVQATDPDIGDNAVITYSIASGNGAGRLAISPLSGVLYTVSSLDREVQEVYALRVTATNTGSSRNQTDTASVAITVLDENDNRPLLLPTPTTPALPTRTALSVGESTLPGSAVAVVPHADGDKGSAGVVTLSIGGGNDDLLFWLNGTTGMLYLNGSLDYETRRQYALHIHLSDGGSPPLVGDGTLWISVLDENDSPPYFLNTNITQTVAATQLQGSDILKVSAYDDDQGANIQYGLIGGTGTAHFSVALLSGRALIQLTTAALGLAGQRFSLVLQATDGQFNVTASITLLVQDLAAGQYFQTGQSSNEYTNSIPDTRGVGGQAARFQVAGSGGSTVSIESPPSSNFLVSGNDILLNAAVDYTVQPRYHLVLRLDDSTTSSARYVQVFINIIASRNYFAPVLPSSVFAFEVPEGPISFTSSVVADIKAEDRDTAPAANSWSTASTAHENLFSLDGTGVLFQRVALDYDNVNEARNYTKPFTAANNRVTPPLQDAAVLYLLVTETNDNSPSFPQSQHFLTLYENRSVSDVPILAVIATDGDVGSSGSLTYGLIDNVQAGGGNYDYRTFQVNSTTGQITLATSLDREENTEFNLQLVAQDGGNPGRSVSTSISIRILDINDNKPIFGQASYPLSIYENTTIATIITRIAATDRDQIDLSQTFSGSNILNGYVTYAIVSGNTGGHFAINTTSGDVSLTVPVDREARDFFDVTVRATDGGGLFTDVHMFLTVLDNNDNPPRFLRPAYSANVSEDAPNGVSLVQVVATDVDLTGLHTEILYAVVGGNPQMAFYVNATTGWISTANSLDREQIGTYDVIVEAYDQGTPRQSSNTTVTISIIDINEFSPVFVGRPYRQAIPESCTVGSFVLQVNTTDADFGVNATARYSILAGNEAEHFTLNPVTGVLSVNQTLDFESMKSYNFTVSAEDTAPVGHQLSSTATVEVYILDVNDNRPVFQDTPFAVSVLETELPGTIVLNISAMDADSLRFGSIDAYILALPAMDDSSSKFTINQTAGHLSLLATLDREMFSQYNFTVTATDGGGLSTSSPVTVTVIDVNDNAPVFPSDTANMTIREDTATNSSVLVVQALDADRDENARLVYTLAQLGNASMCQLTCPSLAMHCSAQYNTAGVPAGAGHFSIDPFSGAIRTNRPLNREAIAEFVIQAVATDQSRNDPRLSGSICVLVSLADVNDETPQFVEALYTGSVAENQLIGTPVLNVSAFDNDLGLNAAITFSLPQTGAASLFAVDPISGLIRTAAVFNRETMGFWRFMVIASDSGSPSRSSTVPVVVNITDLNDNHPQFVFNMPGATEYTLRVAENSAVGTKILQLSSTDADVGLNADVWYYINSTQSAMGANLFNITSQGEVIVAGRLDRELSVRYAILAVAEDRGIPSLRMQAYVRIDLVDVNDNAPVFTNATYSVRVKESVSTGFQLLTVAATDSDEGTNAGIRFSLHSNQLTSTPFSVNATTGLIHVNTRLDSEAVPSYMLNITATDTASNASDRLSSTTTVEVFVDDVNDVVPVFSNAPYQFLVMEGGASPRLAFSVAAMDGDRTSPNNDIVFSIASPLVSPFVINSTTGQVEITRTLDRETQDTYTLVVEATDEGNPALVGNATATVFVLDSNDHVPIFEMPQYSFSVVENLSSGQEIGNVTANDADKNNVTYGIVNDTSTDAFAVDKWTGLISTRRALDREVSDVHTVLVMASDGLPLRSQLSIAEVTVTIIDVNDNMPIFVSPESYSTAVSENHASGGFVLQVVAGDLDTGTNAQLSYSLAPSVDASAFSINVTSGAVSLARDLDFERQQFYEFNVTVSDGGTPSRQATTPVDVTILDENDNIPMFSLPAGYSATIDENTFESWTYLTMASDRDSTSNADLRFLITNGNAGGDFYINATSGLVSIRKSLDYERTPQYNLVLMVHDRGNPSLNSSTFFSITIVDLNDNTPTFAQPVVNVTASEVTPLFSTVTTAVATDRDSTSNSRLRYFISAGNSLGHFTVVEGEGRLVTLSVLDRERQSHYKLTITAADAGVPTRSATQDVNVCVGDVNDDRPSVQGRDLSVMSPGDLSPGSAVYTMSAVDRDLGANSQLRYLFIAGNDQGLFSIGLLSGEVTTTRPFTRDDRVYQLSVGVRDSGDPPLEDQVILTVTVQHSNADNPRFLSPVQSTTVRSSTIIGADVAFAVASDSDFGSSSSALTFQMPGNASSDAQRFTIDSQTGTVAVRTGLTGLEGTTVSVPVCASDGQRSSCQSISVDVTSSQLFSEPSYSFSIREDTLTSSFIGAVRMSSAASFTIQYGDDTRRFSLPANGSLLLMAAVDYETQPVYVLTVAAWDSQSTLIAQVVVRVLVVDVNEFSPQFVASLYRVAVSEATFPGLSIATLSTTDGDHSSLESQTQCRITSGNEYNWFRLTTGACVLSTVTLLDRERMPVVTLNVSAVNFASQRTLVSYATVAITVLDANDHSPVFSASQYVGSVNENAQIGEQVLAVSASDSDTGYNAELFYSIKHASHPGLFALNSSSGSVTVAQPLNSSTVSSTSLVIIAGDFGSPQSLTTPTSVLISIDPVNQYPPQFSQPTYALPISETISPPAVLGVFPAVDADGPQGQVRYALVEASPYFSVDSLTGALLLMRPLNFSVVMNMTVNITAVDQGNPPLQDSVEILLTVADENNHDPHFQVQSYTFSVRELTSVGSVIARLRAFDPDAVSLTYGISRNQLGPSGQNLFGINASTGVLSLESSLDHETAIQYGIEVFALDHGYAHRRSTRQPLTILVVDENDNYPLFQPVPATLNLSRFLPANYQVATVNATDLDRFYGRVTYSLDSDNLDEVLAVDATSGVLTVLRQPGVDAPVEYNITVGASDGELVTNTTVLINFDFYSNFCISAVCYLTEQSVNCFDNSSLALGDACQSCQDGWLPILDGQACASMYCLSASKWVCAPANSTNGTCVPVEQPCQGQRCDPTRSLCQPTGRCLPLSTPQTCDNSSTTCLVDQALVERDQGRRQCENAALLSVTAKACTAAGNVYCALRDRCINVNVPDPCAQCRRPLLECRDTGVCTLDLAECCNGTAFLYCNITRTCLRRDARCELVTTEPPSVTPTPNTAPVLIANALHAGEVRRNSFADTATRTLLAQGVPLSQLLTTAFGGQSFANDNDGDLLGLAVIGISRFTGSNWQYATGADPTVLDCAGSGSAWRDFPAILNSYSALLLGADACVRPTVTDGTYGAIWFQARAFDGSIGGLQNAAGNGSLGTTGRTVTISSTGGMSAYSTGVISIVSIVQPAIEYPSFNGAAQLSFNTLLEDIPFHVNDGTLLSGLLRRPILTRLYSINDTGVANLPVPPREFATVAGNLSDYFDQVGTVNRLVMSRVLAAQSNSQPGLIVTFQLPDPAGRWQISAFGTLDAWLYVDTLLPGTTGSLSVFVDQRARLRFLPQRHYYGQPLALSAQAWDGVKAGGTTTAVPADVLLSVVAPNGLAGQAQAISFWVSDVADRVVNTTTTLRLDAIPYRIRYEYDHAFAIVVQNRSAEVRGALAQFVNFIYLVLNHRIIVRRIEPVTASRAEVLFEVVGDPLALADVMTLVRQKHSVIAGLGFNITDVRDYAFFGRGPSCGASPTLLQPNIGTLVGDITGRGASDADQTPTGLAVIGMNSAQLGVWQYLRRDLNMHGNTSETNLTAATQQKSILLAAAATNQLLSEARLVNTSRSDVWLTFPALLSARRAFLLHARDRVRFSPNPDSYWQAAAAPELQVKFWDIRMGGESGQRNVNTECFLRTTNASAGLLPCQAFSEHVVPLSAVRLGCDGNSESGAVHDECCACAGRGTSCSASCNAAVPNQLYDSCDVCGGSGSTCLGCDSVPFSRQVADGCGVCRGRNTSHDCAGVCFGAAVLDVCGNCTEGTTAQFYNENLDCAGVCYGNASVDSCGDCTGGNTSLAANYRLDCTGQCGGPFRRDLHCGVCRNTSVAGASTADYRDCSGRCFGPARRDACGECYSGTQPANRTLDVCGVCGGSGACPGCDGIAGSGRVVDRCGNCNGNNCGCLRIYDVQPKSGPLWGGTRLRVEGAGFFVNDSSSSGFDAQGNPLPYCGGVIRSTTQTSVQPRCRFRAPGDGFLSSGVSPYHARIVDQSRLDCFIPTDRTTAGLFKVTVQPNNAPTYSVLEDIDASFQLIDISSVRVQSIWPAETLTSRPVNVTLFGGSFTPTLDVRCLLSNMTDCGLVSSQLDADGYYAVVPASVNSTHVVCLLPSVTRSCRTTLYASIDGQASGIIRTSPAGSSSFTYRFQAPVMQSAQFTPGLTALRVSWDQPIQLVRGLASCGGVFADTPLLGGSAARCEWESDEQRVMVITPTASGNLTVGSRLQTRNGAVNTRYQAYPVASTNDVIAVLPPATGLVSAVASISGSSTVPTCGTVAVYGFATAAVGYRAPHYFWAIAAQDSATTNLAQLQASAAAQSGGHVASIQLDASLFETGVDYYVLLTVVNSLNVPSPPARHLLQKTSSTGLAAVRIQGPPQDTVAADESALFRSLVTVATCASIASATTRWELWLTGVATMGEADRLAVSSDLPAQSFLVQGRQLLPGREYYLRSVSTVQLTRPTSSQLTVAALKNITAVRPSLQATIRGGHGSVSAAAGFTLTALVVLSPQASVSLSTLQYRWSCIDGAIVCANSPAVSQLALPPSPDLRVPGGVMGANRTYTFTVQISSGTHSATASSRVRTEPVAVPVVRVLPRPVPAPVAGDRIVIDAWVTAAQPNVTLTWQSVAAAGATVFRLGSNATSMPAGLLEMNDASRYVRRHLTLVPGQEQYVPLALTPRVLQADRTYQINITVAAGSSVSVASVLVQPSTPPSAGSTSVSPASGNEDTQFTLAASNWRAEQASGRLLYRFGLELSNGARQWLSPFSSSNTLRTHLPLSAPSLRVIAQIQGSGGTVVERDPVTVASSGATTASVLASSLQRAWEAHSAYSDWAEALRHIAVLSVQARHRQATAAEMNAIIENAALLVRNVTASVPSTSSAAQFSRDVVAGLSSAITGSGARLTPAASAALLQAINTACAHDLPRQELADLPAGLSPSPSASATPSLSTSRFTANISTEDGTFLLQALAGLTAASPASSREASFSSMRSTAGQVASSICRSLAPEENGAVLEGLGFSSTLQHLQLAGDFCTGDACAAFGPGLQSLFNSWPCQNTDGTSCHGLCVARTSYNPSQLGIASTGQPGDSGVQLEAQSRTRVDRAYPGRNLSDVSLHSQPFSISLLHPVSGSEFRVASQSEAIRVTLPLVSSSPLEADASLVCAYRSSSVSAWTVDSPQSPVVTTGGSGASVAQCNFTHLTQFAVLLVPAPLPTTQPPPTTLPPPTTTPMAAIPTTASQTTQATLPAMVTMTPQPITQLPVVGSSAGAVAGGVLGGLICALVVIAILFYLLYWRKRKAKVVLSVEENIEMNAVSFNKGRPKTAMKTQGDVVQVVMLNADDAREAIGEVTVSRVARLREVRHILTDYFQDVQLDKFYFLKQDLTMIEPAREQSLFISTVYEGTVFVRQVSAAYLASSKEIEEDARLHFCVCGAISNFECTVCSSVGYCSLDCQNRDWEASHQAECPRLAEKRSRKNLLSRRQSSFINNQDGQPVMDRRTSRLSITSGAPNKWNTFVKMKSSSSIVSSPTVGPAQGDVLYGNPAAMQQFPSGEENTNQALLDGSPMTPTADHGAQETSFMTPARRTSLATSPAQSPRKTPLDRRVTAPSGQILPKVRVKSGRRDTNPLEPLARQSSTHAFAPPAKNTFQLPPAFAYDGPAAEDTQVSAADSGPTVTTQDRSAIQQRRKAPRAGSITSLTSSISQRMGKPAKVLDSSTLNPVGEEEAVMVNSTAQPPGNVYSPAPTHSPEPGSGVIYRNMSVISVASADESQPASSRTRTLDPATAFAAELDAAVEEHRAPEEPVPKEGAKAPRTPIPFSTRPEGGRGRESRAMSLRSVLSTEDGTLGTHNPTEGEEALNTLLHSLAEQDEELNEAELV